jgi:hypothetical protein
MLRSLYLLLKKTNPVETLNITDTLTVITEHIISVTPLFQHIDMSRCLVLLSTNRKKTRSAIFGKVVPLRFKDGEDTTLYRGTLFQMPRVTVNQRDLLYLIYYYMPRFIDLPAEEKLNVMFHELYHISPLFNGDIRRMGEKKAAHGHSRDHYDSLYSDELREYLKIVRETPFMKFLNMNSKALFKHFKITANRMKIPKPVKIETR